VLDSISNRENYIQYFTKLRKKQWTIVGGHIAIIVGCIIAYIGSILKPIKIGIIIWIFLLTVLSLINCAIKLKSLINLEICGYDTKYEEITINKIKRNIVNEVYSVIYLKLIRKNIEKGKKYKICYLDNTLIKYIVYIEEIKEDTKK